MKKEIEKNSNEDSTIPANENQKNIEEEKLPYIIDDRGEKVYFLADPYKTQDEVEALRREEEMKRDRNNLNTTIPADDKKQPE